MIDIVFISLIIIATIAFAILGTLFFRKKFGHEHLSRHNEVAGFIYAVIGVVYAVLIAFVVIVVWENLQEAHEIVEDEANSISAIQELSKGFSGDFSKQLLDAVDIYLTKTIEEDWKLMEQGHSIQQMKRKPSDASFSQIRMLIYSFHASSPKEEILQDKLIDKLEDLAENRRMRFFSSRLTVPDFMWFVLIFGAVIVIVFAMLFSTANLWSQLIMMSFLAASISLVLILIYVMNHPFVGMIKVEADSMLNLLR